MNFISMEFLFFFPVVLLVCRKLSGEVRLVFLLLASYLFYMDGISWTGLLLLFSTAISWLFARQIEHSADRKAKKGWLVATLVYGIGCLMWFKREAFLVPGISFYMFQVLSYVLDVYDKNLECEKSFGCYALYVSFFPQLVAGPVERAKDLLPQLKKTPALKAHNFLNGFWLLLRGFFKKLVVADYLAGFVEIVYESPDQAGGFAVVTATFFFALQIYCDFSGYTDIARGAAGMLGIDLMENFAHPYQAENIREFWRRWHISLTKWFTNYLYIPLGGSRKGFFCTCRNIMLVFAVSGLWHGLSLHYVVWGLLHGMYLTIYSIFLHFCTGSQKRKSAENSRNGKERGMEVPTQLERYKERKGTLHRILARLVTFTAVCFAWIFFRADSLGNACTLIQQILFHLTDANPIQLLQFFHIKTIDFVRIVLALFCLSMLEKMPDVPGKIKTREQAAIAALLSFYFVTAIAFAWLGLLAENGGNTFLYFSF